MMHHVPQYVHSGIYLFLENHHAAWLGFPKRSAGELLPRGSYSRMQSRQYQSIDNTIVQLRISQVIVFDDGDAGSRISLVPTVLRCRYRSDRSSMENRS